MPFETLAEEILAEWVTLQADLATLDPDSPEAWNRRARMARLRDAYEQLILEARAEHGAEPPAFPLDAREDGPVDIPGLTSGTRDSPDGR